MKLSGFSKGGSSVILIFVEVATFVRRIHNLIWVTFHTFVSMVPLEVFEHFDFNPPDID